MASQRAIQRTALAILGGLAIAAPTALAGGSTQRFFTADSGKISCELDDGGGLGVEAYCQTIVPPRSVTLSASGHVKTCSGQRCVGNPPENDRALPPGHLAKLGRFTCKATSTAVDCSVKSGASFSISTTGVKQT